LAVISLFFKFSFKYSILAVKLNFGISLAQFDITLMNSFTV